MEKRRECVCEYKWKKNVSVWYLSINHNLINRLLRVIYSMSYSNLIHILILTFNELFKLIECHAVCVTCLLEPYTITALTYLWPRYMIDTWYCHRSRCRSV